MLSNGFIQINSRSIIFIASGIVIEKTWIHFTANLPKDFTGLLNSSALHHVQNQILHTNAAAINVQVQNDFGIAACFTTLPQLSF